MTSHPTVVARAALRFGLVRYTDHRGLWLIDGVLPGVEDLHRTEWCSFDDDDEMWTWANDFHGESKTWRSLMDCVASDWCATQSKLC